jgi:hypothetical protein
MDLRLYPSRPGPTIARDLALLLSLLAFGWLGMLVHDGVAQLASLGRGLQDSGRSVSRTATDATGAVRSGLETAAGTVEGVPIVGGQLAEGLRRGGEEATRPVQRSADAQAARLVEAGREGERRAYALANLLGWLSFLVPSALALAWFLPGRVAQARRWTAASRALRDAPEDELARRAAFNLPYAALLRHTRDPFGDLADGEHAALLAALAEDAGVPVRAAPVRAGR